jgi:hypothetical protein
MVSLSNWSLHSLTHRREIRNLASAFVGEIAAILHLIETHDLVSILEKALDASDSGVALPTLMLPPFTIYTVDAARLDDLPFPAPRKIAYFYAQIASIRDDLTLLATEPVPKCSADSRTKRIRCVLTELNDALALGDDILRELRPLLSPKHQKSLTRARSPSAISEHQLDARRMVHKRKAKPRPPVPWPTERATQASLTPRSRLRPVRRPAATVHV